MINREVIVFGTFDQNNFLIFGLFLFYDIELFRSSLPIFTFFKRQIMKKEGIYLYTVAKVKQN